MAAGHVDAALDDDGRAAAAESNRNDPEAALGAAVWVGGLPDELVAAGEQHAERRLRKLFGTFGTIAAVSVRHKAGGGSWAFVMFEEYESAKAAVAGGAELQVPAGAAGDGQQARRVALQVEAADVAGELARARASGEGGGAKVRQLWQKENEKVREQWEADVEPLIASADSGDIVLTSRRCLNCSSWYGAFICAVTKEASTSKWNDVALVVRDQHGEPQLLCATLDGVTLTPLRERVHHWKFSKRHVAHTSWLWGDYEGTEVVVRNLEFPRTPKLRADLEEFARSMVGTQFEESFAQLLSSIMNSQTMQDRERLEVLRKTAQTQLGEIQHQLLHGAHGSGSGLVQRSLHKEEVRLEHEIEELERSIAVRDRASSTWFGGVTDLDQVHASELVAGALMSMHMLGSFPPASSYNPASFSADAPGNHRKRRIRQQKKTEVVQSKLHLLQDARLGAQIHLTPNVDTDAAVPGTRRRANDEVPWHSPKGKESVQFALQRHAVLSTLKKDDLIALSEAFEPRRFADGDTIFERSAHDDFSDDTGEGAWVTVQGSVRSYTQREDNAVLEVAAEHASRELLGVDEVLSGRRLVRRHHSATCHDKAGCEVWRCARGQVRTLAQRRLAPAALRDVHSRLILENAIENHFLFASLSVPETQKVVESFARVEFKAGEVVMREGDPASYMYVLEAGELEVNKEMGEAVDAGGERSTVKVGTMRSGALFGDWGLIFEAKRSATVIAQSDCVLWAHGREDLVRLGQSRPIRQLFDDNASTEDKHGEPCMTRADFLHCIGRRAATTSELDDGTGRTAADSPGGSAGLAHIRQRNAELMLELVDSNNDGMIDFVEFLRFDLLLNKPNAEVEICFRLADTDHNGTVSLAEFEAVWKRLDLGDNHTGGPPPARLLKRFAEKGELGIDEFSELWAEGGGDVMARLKGTTGRMVLGWKSAILHPTAQNALNQQSDSDLISVGEETPWRWHMLGLCASSALAHTVVAPLDRLKIMQQALGPASLHDTRWMGMRGIFSLWETEGLRGLWRGHTAGLLRIAPLIFINSYLFGLLRPVALHAEQGKMRYPEPLSPMATLLVSGTAGMTAQAVVHPLDLLRAKMCVQTRGDVVTPRFCPDTPGQWAGLSESVRGVWQRRSERNRYDPRKYDTRSLREAYREQVRVGGVRGLWRGAAPAMIGAGLWTGLSFTISDSLLPLMPREANGSGQPQAAYAMTAALWASRISQAASYPFDTLKRSMQCAPANSSAGMRTEYSALVAEGGRMALFRGFPVMLCKIAPSVSVSYFTYHGVISLAERLE